GHMHQFAGMPAHEDANPQSFVKWQRGHDDALRQILAGGELNHVLQMPAKLTQKRSVQSMVVVLAANDRGQPGRRFVIAAALHPHTYRHQVTATVVQGTKDGARIKSSGKRKPDSGPARRLLPTNRL